MHLRSATAVCLVWMMVACCLTPCDGQSPAPADAYEYFDISGVGLEMPRDQVIKAMGRQPDDSSGDVATWRNPQVSVEFGAGGTVKRVRGRLLRLNRGDVVIRADDSSAHVRQVLGPYEGTQQATREGGFQRVWLRKTATIRVTFDDKGYATEVVLGLPREH